MRDTPTEIRDIVDVVECSMLLQISVFGGSTVNVLAAQKHHFRVDSRQRALRNWRLGHSGTNIGTSMSGLRHAAMRYLTTTGWASENEHWSNYHRLVVIDPHICLRDTAAHINQSHASSLSSIIRQHQQQQQRSVAACSGRYSTSMRQLYVACKTNAVGCVAIKSLKSNANLECVNHSVRCYQTCLGYVEMKLLMVWRRFVGRLESRHYE